ncbi:MAG: LTA synthase family protein [Bacteroidales bacterium]|nr:LTA synthase family protein [Candidatus Colicola coprequi]
MKERFVILAKYYLFWVLFFAVQKPIFLIWQHRLMGDISFCDWFRVIGHGLPLDLSVAAYIAMVMGLILCISVWVKPRITQILSDILTSICLFIGLWTLLGDNGCFPAWGYHLDKSIFVYLSSPREALACAEWWVWILALIAFVILFVVALWTYRKIIFSTSDRLSLQKEISKSITQKVLHTLPLLLVTCLLFLPARGSVTVSTMNTGRVYFSDNTMLNQAAINPLFNIVESLSEQTFDTRKYTYMTAEDASAAIRPLYSFDPTSTTHPQISNADHVILIILEGFSLNAWDAMPHVQQLAEQGIFFANAYASSYRTDRGVVATLSGFPGQPTSSLMTAPAKSAHLPNLGLSLSASGYKTRFFYGGDEDFTNMRSYLVAGGFIQRYCDKDFPLSDRLSKWGVPDHILLPFASNEIAQNSLIAGNKSFDVILSLSSHEPFDVPYHHLDHPYLNSIAYTDSCLGAFVEKLSVRSEWNNTLLVLVADHGYPYPDGLQNFQPERYRIPMVIAGGAISKPQQVHTLCSQIDLAPTLLAYMGLDYSSYQFGKNILSDSCPEFAFYSFNDGFGLIYAPECETTSQHTAPDTIVIDAKSNLPLIHSSNQSIDTLARAMMQSIMQSIDSL